MIAIFLKDMLAFLKQLLYYVVEHLCLYGMFYDPNQKEN